MKLKELRSTVTEKDHNYPGPSNSTDRPFYPMPREPKLGQYLVHGILIYAESREKAILIYHLHQNQVTRKTYSVEWGARSWMKEWPRENEPEYAKAKEAAEQEIFAEMDAEASVTSTIWDQLNEEIENG